MSPSKKKTARKRSGAYSYPPVSLILHGVKYKAGQKPVRVCPEPAVASRPLQLERFMADALRATADDIQQLRDDRVPFAGGRVKGRINKKTVAVRAHIRELLEQHPRLEANVPQLYDKADKKIIGAMAEKTFGDHVRAVRKNRFPI